VAALEPASNADRRQVKFCGDFADGEQVSILRHVSTSAYHRRYRRV
jgi:hypothetical protein